MDKTLKALYDSFYTPPAMPVLESEVKSAHRKPIERLDKQERQLVLQIIDAQDAIAHDRFLDSFICGFKLARQMTHELNVYKNEYPEIGLAGLGTRSAY